MHSSLNSHITRSNLIFQVSQNPSCIRNICLLAHVDHGKTTFADHLISSNGLIAKRTAGKLRYMDNKKEEQDRGITIKSSCISLLYESANQHDKFLINLIDSPGHIDFSNEVSIAVRLSDGAVVLIDVVEGLCPQTQTVIRQTWNEGLPIILVLNKIDRLIMETKLTPMEAYTHIENILSEVNSFFSELIASAHFTMQDLNENKKEDLSFLENDMEFNAPSDESLYFCPTKGNVLFASALDGWLFSIATFSELYAKKLGFSRNVLNKTLWGDYYFHTKEKMIRKGAKIKQKKPLFVSFILDPVWNVYDKVLINRDNVALVKVFKGLGLTLPPKELDFYESKYLLTCLIMQQWLPLATNFYASICEKLPSPLEMTEDRLKVLIHHQDIVNGEEYNTKYLKAILNCESNDTTIQDCNMQQSSVPTIAFICKIFKCDSDTLTSTAFAKKSNHQTICNGRNINGILKNSPHYHLNNIERDNISNNDSTFMQKLADRRQKLKQYKARFNDTNPILNIENHQNTIKNEDENIETNDENKLVETDETASDDHSKCINDNQKFVFLALCKIYSGQLEPNQNYYILQSKTHSENSDNLTTTLEQGVINLTTNMQDDNHDNHLYKLCVKRIFMCQGGNEDLTDITQLCCTTNNLVETKNVNHDFLPAIKAGNVVVAQIEFITRNNNSSDEANKLANMDDKRRVPYDILRQLPKTLTISSDKYAPYMSNLYHYAQPLLEVAIEPKKIGLYQKLHQALKLLCASDPSSKFYLNNNGQLILKIIGEVHLEHCILELAHIMDELSYSEGNHDTSTDTNALNNTNDNDLVEQFHTHFSVSKPIVPFRETITSNYQYDFITSTDEQTNINSIHVENSKQQSQENSTCLGSNDTVLKQSKHSDNPKFISILRNMGVILQVPALPSLVHKTVDLNVETRYITNEIADTFEKMHNSTKNWCPMYTDLLNGVHSSLALSSDTKNFNSAIQLLSTTLSSNNENCKCDRVKRIKRLAKLEDRNKATTVQFNTSHAVTQIGELDCVTTPSNDGEEIASIISHDSFIPLSATKLDNVSIVDSYKTGGSDSIIKPGTKGCQTKTTGSESKSHTKAHGKYAAITPSFKPFCWCTLGILYAQDNQRSKYLPHERAYVASYDNSNINLLIYNFLFLSDFAGAKDGIKQADLLDMPVSIILTQFFMSPTLNGSIINAFNQIVASGPLCGEPMRNISFIINDMYIRLNYQSLLLCDKYLQYTLSKDKSESSNYEDESPCTLNNYYYYVSLNALANYLSNQKLPFANGQIQFDEAFAGTYANMNTSIETLSLKLCLTLLINGFIPITPSVVDDKSIEKNFSKESCQQILQAGTVGSQIKNRLQYTLYRSSLRLMLAMYACDVQVNVEVLGKMYGVLHKRHGKIVSEESIEGTQLFSVKSLLPMVESFGFTHELRTKTSGLANPQLSFAKWEILDEEPLSKAELEELSCLDNSTTTHFKTNETELNDEIKDMDENDSLNVEKRNRAQTYLNAIRVRKGLLLAEKLVEKAEKQRTLKKNV